MVPVAFDQPDNARRSQLLGVGRAMPFRKTSAALLASALHDLLTDSHYAVAASALADALATVDGAASAALELIACLRPRSVAG